MAAPKIKKKATTQKTSALPRQGAIPCLVLLGLGLLIIAFFFFAALRNAG
jgi:hypothetical protein